MCRVFCFKSWGCHSKDTNLPDFLYYTTYKTLGIFRLAGGHRFCSRWMDFPQRTGHWSFVQHKCSLCVRYCAWGWVAFIIPFRRVLFTRKRSEVRDVAKGCPLLCKCIGQFMDQTPVVNSAKNTETFKFIDAFKRLDKVTLNSSLKMKFILSSSWQSTPKPNIPNYLWVVYAQKLSYMTRVTMSQKHLNHCCCFMQFVILSLTVSKLMQETMEEVECLFKKS